MISNLFWRCLALSCILLALAPIRAEEDTPPTIPGASTVDPDNPDLAGHFSGVVLGPDGKPFTGAKVYVVPISKDLRGQMVSADELGAATVRTTTGVDGRFDIHAPDVTLTDLDGLPTNRLCLVLATAQGYGPDWVHVRGRTRSNSIVHPNSGTNLKLQLAADDVPLQGRILGPDGKPLADARVQLRSIMIPKGGDLEAHLEREIKKSVHSGFLSGSSPYERTLYYPQLLSPSNEVRTDADGRFILTEIGRDRFVSMKVSAPTAIDSHFTAMTRNGPDVATRLGGKAQIAEEVREYYLLHGARFTRQLEPGRTISGVVLDGKTRKPIPNMLVGTGHEGYPRDGIRGHRTATDAQGRFNITGLDPQAEKWAVTAVSPPGTAYQSASVTVADDSPVEIVCEPGIPFRINLTDEQGHPVDAEVNYFEVRPNPYAPKLYCFPSSNPISDTLKTDDGSYTGFALPGPGVVLVTTFARDDYLPPRVDVQAFFSADNPKDYGTRDTVNTVMGAIRQNNYAAIVLVNPTPDSPPLELSAIVKKGTPRQVTLVDAKGQPIIGVKTDGLTDYGSEPPLRAATFPLFKLHPERDRRIIFQHEVRKLTGYLVARGDGDSPYTVTLQPWATIKGRLVDETGNPLPLGQKDSIWEQALHVKASLPADPDYRHAQYADVDPAGRFRLDKLIPGQPYEGLVYQNQGKFRHSAFADLMLKAGETRDVGDIRLAVQSLAENTPGKPRSTMNRKDLREPLAVSGLLRLAHDSPTARLPQIARVAVDGR
jgi:hypothetical protein